MAKEKTMGEMVVDSPFGVWLAVMLFALFVALCVGLGWILCSLSLRHQSRSAELDMYRAQRAWYQTQAKMILQGVEPRKNREVEKPKEERSWLVQ